ncbi:hypothetical protein HK102_005330, partial [Quaeritorhiza haematococci]
MLASHLASKFADHPNPVLDQEELRLFNKLAKRSQKLDILLSELSTGVKRFEDLKRDQFLKALVDGLLGTRNKADLHMLWLGATVLGILCLASIPVAEWYVRWRQQKAQQRLEDEYFDTTVHGEREASNFLEDEPVCCMDDRGSQIGGYLKTEANRSSEG